MQDQLEIPITSRWPLQNLRIVRILLLAIGLFTLAWHPLLLLLEPETLDPFVYRVILSSLCFIALLGSYQSSRLRQRVTKILLIVMQLLTLHALYLLHANQLGMTYLGMAALLVLLTVTAATSRRDLNHVTILTLVVAGFTCFAFDELEPKSFVSWAAILTVLSFGYILAVNRLGLMEAMEQKAANYRDLFESTVEGILVHLDGKVHQVNKAFCAMSGYEASEMTSIHVSRFLHADDHEMAREAVALKYEAPYQARFVRKDGSIFLAEITGKTYHRSGHDYRFTTIRDITRSVEAAARLQEAKRIAESANRAKSQFLARMSHEIRTPMYGVFGMVEVLSRTALSTDQQRYLDVIKKSGHDLLVILNEVLDLSRLESGILKLNLEPFDLLGLAREVRDLLMPLASDKNLQFLLDTPAVQVANVIGDRQKLRQILINLVGNAIKFTDRGFVRLAIQMDQENDHATASQWLLSVQDTGNGIPAEAQQQIFERFAQVDETALGAGSPQRGVGLGLAIVKELVQLLGGTITLQSVVGEGSTFNVKVPLSSEFLSPQSVEVPLSDGFSEDILTDLLTTLPTLKATVLLVEDNPTNQLITGLLLKQLGCDVTLVDSAQQAIAGARERRFDLILMDRQLPDMDGEHAIAQMRHDKLIGDTPLILMTAHVQPEVKGQLLANQQIDDVLLKPFLLVDLATMLAKWIKKSPDELGQTSRASQVSQVQANTDIIKLNKQLEEGLLALPELFDLKTINTLLSITRGASNPNFLGQLVLSFTKGADIAIKEMAELADGLAIERLKAVVHKLSGGAKNIGLLTLGRLCDQLEDRADQLSERELKQQLNEIISLVSLIKIRMKPLLTAIDQQSALNKPA